MRNTVKLPTISNANVQGGHCVLNCPLGLTYDFIQFKLTNLAAADLKNFKVKVGSRTLVEVSSAGVLDDLNIYYKRVVVSGYFTLWFYRPEWATEEERALTSMGTADVPQLTIEWDNAPGVASPDVSAWAVQRAPMPMGLVTKIREYPVTFATGGKQDIDNIPRTASARITAVHLGKADVSEVEFEINQGTGTSKIIEADKALLEANQTQHNRAPVTAKYTHVDFNLLGKINGPLPLQGLQDMRVRPTLTTSGQLTSVVEYLDGYNGI
jgi:hypothetical protein